MSIEAINKVWKTSKQRGSALLLLLAIADYAKDDGSNAWPSLQTLAKKTRMSRRNVIKLVQKLETNGELQVRREQGPGGTNFYDIIFPQVVNPSSSSSKQDSEPQFTPPVNPSSPSVVNPSSLKPLLEPSINHHFEQKQKKFTPYQLAFGYLAKICKIDLGLMSKKQEGQLGKESSKLIKAGIDPPEIEQFEKWWYKCDWRGKKGQPPLPSQISENWGQFRQWENTHDNSQKSELTPQQAQRARELHEQERQELERGGFSHPP